MLRMRFDFKGEISVYLFSKTALKKTATDSRILKCKIKESVAKKIVFGFLFEYKLSQRIVIFIRKNNPWFEGFSFFKIHACVGNDDDDIVFLHFSGSRSVECYGS